MAVRSCFISWEKILTLKIKLGSSMPFKGKVGQWDFNRYLVSRQQRGGVKRSAEYNRCSTESIDWKGTVSGFNCFGWNQSGIQVNPTFVLMLSFIKKSSKMKIWFGILATMAFYPHAIKPMIPCGKPDFHCINEKIEAFKKRKALLPFHSVSGRLWIPLLVPWWGSSLGWCRIYLQHRLWRSVLLFVANASRCLCR